MARLARRHARHNPDQRPLWIAGLAGVAVLLVGGIALAATKKGGGGGPQPLPTSTPNGPQQVAASKMADALIRNGYRTSDQAIYQAFQSAAGLSPTDGFPGTHTMTALDTTLRQMGAAVSMIVDGYTGQQIVVYQWLTTCSTGTGDQCYNGTDAPTFAEWNR